MTSTKESTIAMTKFTQYNAFKKLKELAANPFDLTKEGNLTPDRIGKFVAESCGYKFLYGTERVTEKVMQTLEELADEAHVIEKMQKMQSGEVLNIIEGYPSENRMVLRYRHQGFLRPSQYIAKGPGSHN